MAELGSHKDEGKPRVDLLDSEALEGLARVLSFGCHKYAAHNWRGGIAWSRIIGSILRHLFAIMRGEDTDPESGLPHIDHLGCDWMFLSYFMKHRKDLDDRWKPNQTVTAGASGEGSGSGSNVRGASEQAADGVDVDHRTTVGGAGDFRVSEFREVVDRTCGVGAGTEEIAGTRPIYIKGTF